MGGLASVAARAVQVIFIHYKVEKLLLQGEGNLGFTNEPVNQMTSSKNSFKGLPWLTKHPSEMSLQIDTGHPLL